MSDTLTTIRPDIRTMLGVATQITEEDIDRAVFQAVAILSRFFPREVVAQTVFNEDITNDPFTSSFGTAVTLANKPIRFASETVTTVGSSTAFVKDTDYEIDYINGTITVLASGSMADSTSHEIDYKLDGTMIDISNLLTEPISIDQVDVIRNDKVPAEFESWVVHGDFLMITGTVNQSQIRFIDNDHIRIYYLANHAEPTITVSGSYPDFLDEVVLTGAAGYVLLMEAMEQEYQAVTDLASARTAIANIAAIHTAIATTVTSLATAQADTNIALDKAFIEITLGNAEYDKVQAIQTLAESELATANTELDKAASETTLAATEAALANTELDKVDGVDGGIPEAVTELKLLIVALASGGDFDTALDKVDTHVGTEAIAALDLINAELLLGNTALDNVDSHLNSGTRNADLYLDTGDNVIATINVARNEAGENREYALAKVEIARGYTNEATGRFQHSQALVGEAAQRIAAAAGFTNEAMARLRAVEDKLTLVTNWLGVSATHQRTAQGFDTNASVYIQVSQAFQSAGERFTNNARTYTEEARTYIQNGDGYVSVGVGYIQEAVQRLSAVSRYVEEINTRLAQIRAYLEEATIYHNSAASQREGAELFRGEGQTRVREFIATLEDRVQISTHPRISSVRQYSSDSRPSYPSFGSLTSY